MTLLATRRQADDLQIMLDGGRPRSPRAADDLGALVILASALRPTPQQPRPAFRAELRQHLVAKTLRPASARPPSTARPQARRSASWRIRQVAATVAVASVVAGVGAAAASTQALPGDTLYGLKRHIEAAQLGLARGDVARGRELLDQANARLSEAEALTAARRGPQTGAFVGRALTDLNIAFSQAAEDLTQAYRDSGDDEPLVVLDRFISEHRDRLADLMDLLDPALRAQARELADRFAVIGARLAAVLGEPASLSPAAEAIPEAGLSARSEVGSARRAAGSVATSGRLAADAKAATGPSRATGGLLDSLGGAAGARAGSTGPGTDRGGAASGGLLGDLTGQGGTASGPGLPTATSSPLPVTGLVPTAVPTALPSDPVGAVTSTVPLPVSASVCVPLPPLTSCP